MLGVVTVWVNVTRVPDRSGLNWPRHSPLKPLGEESLTDSSAEGPA